VVLFAYAKMAALFTTVFSCRFSRVNILEMQKFDRQ